MATHFAKAAGAKNNKNIGQNNQQTLFVCGNSVQIDVKNFSIFITIMRLKRPINNFMN